MERTQFQKLAALAANELGLKEKSNLTKICILNDMKECGKSNTKRTPNAFFKGLIEHSQFTFKMGDYGTLRCMMTIEGFMPQWINLYIEDGDGFSNEIDIEEDFKVDKSKIAITLYETSKGNHFTAFYCSEPIANIDDVVTKIC